MENASINTFASTGNRGGIAHAIRNGESAIHSPAIASAFIDTLCPGGGIDVRKISKSTEIIENRTQIQLPRTSRGLYKSIPDCTIVYRVFYRTQCIQGALGHDAVDAVDTDAVKNQKPRICVLGPLRLVNLSGDDCTPSGAIRKTLFAILALSRNGTRSRSRLQTLVWENSPQSQGAANLRTAISTLRKELRNGLGFDPITADTQSVSLDLSLFDIDLRQAADTSREELLSGQLQILEGLQLRSRDCEEFEDWLRSVRQQMPDFLELPGQSQPDSTMIITPSVTTPASDNTQGANQTRAIGLLPVIVTPVDELLKQFGNTMLDVIATDLTSLARIDVYDYRDEYAHTNLTDSGSGADVHLRLKILIGAGQFTVHFYAYVAATQKIVIGSSVTGEIADGLNLGNDTILGFITQNVDRMLNWLEKPENIDTLHPDTPYHILNTMFRYEPTAIDAAGQLLSDAITTSQEPVYTGLLAYLNTFKVGEHWGKYDRSVKLNSQELVNQTLEQNPIDGVTLATTGHVLGYTLHNHSLSGDLLQKSIKLNPTIAFCWDHLALHYLYIGDYIKAKNAAKHAILLGAYSPFRFSYETTMCMVYTLTGEHKKAVEYGKRALSRRPNSGAALRYTTVSLALSQSSDISRDYAQRLLQLDPEFSLDWLETGRWSLPSNDAKKLITRGLILAGIQ